MYAIYDGPDDLTVVSLFSALGLVLSLAVIPMMPEEALSWAFAQLEATGR